MSPRSSRPGARLDGCMAVAPGAAHGAQCGAPGAVDAADHGGEGIVAALPLSHAVGAPAGACLAGSPVDLAGPTARSFALTVIVGVTGERCGVKSDRYRAPGADRASGFWAQGHGTRDATYPPERSTFCSPGRAKGRSREGLEERRRTTRRKLSRPRRPWASQDSKALSAAHTRSLAALRVRRRAASVPARTPGRGSCGP